MRRTLAAALAASVLLLVAGYAAVASIAVGRTVSVEAGALLAAPQSELAGRVDALPASALRSAMAAMPLDQRIADVAMVREQRQEGDARLAAWLPVVARLGWRDTPSLQNLLYAAVEARDLPRILDVSDALLRRRKLMEQIVPALSLMEPEPALRQPLAERLAAGPSWRGAYLTTTAQLHERSQLLARYALLRRIRQDGARLDPTEVAPNVNALDRAGLPAHGFALWRMVAPQIARPLDDPRFAQASRSYRQAYDPVPYQWQMTAGEGWSASATSDGGRTALAIDWDGRGVPVFAQQRTSAPPGHYALAVATKAEDAADLAALAFRLACGDTVIGFRSTGPGRYVTDGAVACAFPVLQIAGDVQPSAVAHQLSIDEVNLIPLAPAGR